MAGIRMVKRYDDGEGQFACYLVFLSLVAQAAAISLNVLGYVYFSDRGSTCGSSTVWVNVITSLIIVGLPILQFFNFNVQNSLLTTALVSMYVSYLSFIAQFSFAGQNDTCSKMSLESLIVDVIVSTFFFILTMYGSITGGSGQVKVTQNGDINRAMGVAPTTERQNGQNQKNFDLNDQVSSHQAEHRNELNQWTYKGWTWVKWHFYMCLSSIYVGMLITNWSSASIISGELEPSSFGFWVRICMSWVTTLLYIWTLLAPKVFPDRDFVVQ